MKFFEEKKEQKITDMFEREDKLKELILETKHDDIAVAGIVVLGALQDRIQKIHIAPAGD